MSNKPKTTNLVPAKPPTNTQAETPVTTTAAPSPAPAPATTAAPATDTQAPAGDQQATTTTTPETPVVETPVSEPTKNEPEAPATDLGVSLGDAASVQADVGQIAPQSLGLSFPWSQEVLGYLERLKNTGNRRAFDALHEVDWYCTQCARTNLIGEEAIARASLRLLRAIVGVVEYGGEEFALTFATLLMMFEENGGDPTKFGALSDYLIYRGQAYWTGNGDEFKAFNQLIPVLRAIAPVKGRSEALRLVNVNKSLELLFTEAGKGRVRAFLDI